MIDNLRTIETKHEGMIVSVQIIPLFLIKQSMMFNMIIMDNIWPLALQMVNWNMFKC